MRLRILLIAVITIAWAETKSIERPVRAAQQQTKYDDGSKTTLKHLVPQAQWQRSQRAEGGSPHRLRQVQQAAQHVQVAQVQPQQPHQLPLVQSQQFYKPYSAVPAHIKQLIQQTYQPQPPYVDPTSFLYSASFVAPQHYDQQQPASAASQVPRAAYLQPSVRYQSIDPARAQSRIDYGDTRIERQDDIVYKEDYEERQQPIHQIALPAGTMPEPPLPTLYLDKNMPTEIKQLLQFQAQIPYDVIANRIQYKPKNIFIPKPLSDDVKGPYYYRSKVYYTNDDNVDGEYPLDKPVDEQQH